MPLHGALAYQGGEWATMRIDISRLMVSIAAATLALAFGNSAAPAAVIKFDDLQSSLITDGPISNPYDGFNWDNVWVLANTDIPNTGYQFGAVSTPNIAYDGYGFGGSFSVTSGTFAFNGAYFTGAYNPEDVTVTGLLGGSPVDTATFPVSNTSPTWETFNWQGIDTIQFIGVGPNRSQVVIDNVTVNNAITPLPSTWMMLIAGSLGLGFFANRGTKKIAAALAS